MRQASTRCMGRRMGGGGGFEQMLPAAPPISPSFSSAPRSSLTAALNGSSAMPSLRAACLLAACLCLAGTALAQEAAVVRPRVFGGCGRPWIANQSAHRLPPAPNRTPASSPSWPSRAWAWATAGRAWATVRRRRRRRSSWPPTAAAPPAAAAVHPHHPPAPNPHRITTPPCRHRGFCTARHAAQA